MPTTAPTASPPAVQLPRSQEEIQALKALVSETLAKRGVLGRIKAELRANVCSVIQQEAPAPQEDNVKFQRLKGTREGRLLLDLVAEFLEFFDLRNSNSVYTAEVGLSESFEQSLRPIIVQEINLTHDHSMADEPLLMTLLRQYEQRVRGARSSSNLNLARSRDSLGQQAQRRPVLSEDLDVSPPKQNIDLLPKSVHSSSDSLAISQELFPLELIPAPSTTTTFGGSPLKSSSVVVQQNGVSSDTTPQVSSDNVTGSSQAMAVRSPEEYQEESFEEITDDNEEIPEDIPLTNPGTEEEDLPSDIDLDRLTPPMVSTNSKQSAVRKTTVINNQQSAVFESEVKSGTESVEEDIMSDITDSLEELLEQSALDEPVNVHDSNSVSQEFF